MKRSSHLSKSKEKPGVIEQQVDVKAKHQRNVKNSIFDSKFIHLTELNIVNNDSVIICPKNKKLNECKSFLIKDFSKNTHDSSFKISERSELESLKSRLCKKIDFSRVCDLKTNNTININDTSNENSFKLIKRQDTKKSSYNIKTILELNSKKLCLSNLLNISKI